MSKILQENIKRIKSLLYINEQNENLIVTGNYTANNCDELHAFLGTGGKVIGDMNVIVTNKIKEWNQKNIYVKPISVKVNVNGMTVKWEVSFEKSLENFNGFTSRGAGCNNDIEKRAGNDSINNGKQSVIDKLSSQGVKVIKIEEVGSYTYNRGRDSFKQVFYRYITENNNSQKKEIQNLQSKPCKQQTDIKTDETETQIIGYIYEIISKNLINFDKCKQITSLPERTKCIEDVKLHSRQMSETMNFLISKRDNGTELNPMTKKIVLEYQKYLDNSRLDYYYNKGTCVTKSTITTN